VGLVSSAVLYLPTVAGSFVTAITASSLGSADWGRLAFGAGLFSRLAVESVLLHRLSTVTTLQPALRPTLGIDASWRHRARRNPGTFAIVTAVIGLLVLWTLWLLLAGRILPPVAAPART
jgi:hypothetical protein